MSATNKHSEPGKTPAKAKSLWRRQSQTARILENVEMLIALHQTQEHEGQDELTRLVNELDSWKKESHGLLEETNSLVAEVEKQTNQQLQAKASDIIQAVESQINERFDRLDCRVSEIAETVAKQQDSGHKHHPKSNDQDLDVEQLLSQQGQELDARLELFTEHFDDSLEKRMAEIRQRISKITDLVGLQQNLPVTGGTVDSSVLTRLAEQNQHDFSEKIELVTDRFDEKTEELVRTIQLQFEEQLEQRFEKLNDHVIKITSALEGQQLLLEAGNASASDPGSLASEQFSKKIDAIADSFNSRIDDLFGSLGNRISSDSKSIARPETESETRETIESDEDTASHWHRQKTAMLSKYGIDPDYRPLMELPDNSAEDSAPDAELEEVTENLESLHDSIENISAADAEAIENLKEELTSKLRDAEIEFSINRAKLSQLKAELDDKQVELERRASALEEKYGGMTSSENKSGFLDRLARHLTLRKSD